MNKLSKIVLWGAAAATLAATGAYLEAAAPRVATLAMAKGTVQVKQPGSTAWVTASKSMPLYEGTVLKTGGGSAAIVRLDDGSMTKVAPLSVFKLATMAASGATKNTKVGLDLGKTWNRVNKLRDASDFKMDTPSAVAGIRGTYFGSEVNRGADTDMDFWEGEGLVTSKSDGSSTTVKANQGVSVGNGKGVGDVRAARDAGEGLSNAESTRHRFDLDVKVTPEIVRRGEVAKVKVQLLRDGEAYPGRATFKVTLGGGGKFTENDANTIEVQSNDSGLAELDITSENEEKVSVDIEVSLSVQ